MPESAPPSYVDDRHPAPSATYLPPSASHPIQPTAYVHHPTTYVPPPAAHLVPYDPYARPYSHLAPLTTQFSMPSYNVTTTGHPYQSGYEAYGPLPATYQCAQEPPLRYVYAQAQHPMSEHVPSPVYSTDPYFAAHRSDPYQFDAVKSHYQENISESTAYGAAHETVTTNLQLVRHYGSTPSNEIATPEAAMTNLGLVRSYGSVPSSATEGTTQSHADGAASAMYYYAGAPATYTQAESVAAPAVSAVAAAPAYL